MCNGQAANPSPKSLLVPTCQTMLWRTLIPKLLPPGPCFVNFDWCSQTILRVKPLGLFRKFLHKSRLPNVNALSRFSSFLRSLSALPRHCLHLRCRLPDASTQEDVFRHTTSRSQTPVKLSASARCSFKFQLCFGWQYISSSYSKSRYSVDSFVVFPALLCFHQPSVVPTPQIKLFWLQLRSLFLRVSSPPVCQCSPCLLAMVTCSAKRCCTRQRTLPRCFVVHWPFTPFLTVSLHGPLLQFHLFVTLILY